MKSIKEIRNDFPILQEKIYDKPLVYLDNGATTQLPRCVLECWSGHYMHQNANVHRGVHLLSEQSTMAMENVRTETAEFIHSESPEQIIFTSGATDSLNTVASGYAFPLLKPGKKVIVTEFEHHSNFVPWQKVARKAGASFVAVPVHNDMPDMDFLERELDENTVMLSVTAVSNVMGLRLPLEKMISMAHARKVPVCIDASQAMRHGEMNVQDLDCEFMVFSGHKMMGPTGVGILYGKQEYLKKTEPVRFGGGMVDVVNLEDTSFGALPYCLEAGTPNYPGIIAFGEALRYLKEIGLTWIAEREKRLTDHLEEVLRETDGVQVLGGRQQKYGVVSVAVDGIHPYDLSSILDKYGIAERSGNHCAQPLLSRLGYDSVLRFSPAFYNTIEEIDYVGECMKKAVTMLRKWK